MRNIFLGCFGFEENHFFQKNVDFRNMSPVMLNGDRLTLVRQGRRQGNTLQCDTSMKINSSQKSGKFIGKLNSLSQEFQSLKPMSRFSTSSRQVSMSSLWNMYPKDCERFFTSWNVAMRQCFSVDRLTHRYIIESMSAKLHPKNMTFSGLANL